MPDGTLAGGGIPGPALDVHGAGATIDTAAAADGRSGATIAIKRRNVLTRPAIARNRLRRSGLRFLRIDPEVGDGLGNQIRTVLLTERERV